MRKLFLFLVVLFLSFQQLTLAAIKEMTSTPDSVYLFSFATSGDDGRSGLRFAWSTDKENWFEIGRNYGYLRCDYSRWGSQKKMLDPYLKQSSDGEWICPWKLNDHDGYGQATSKDLINWTSQKYPRTTPDFDGVRVKAIVAGEEQKGNINRVAWTLVDGLDKNYGSNPLLRSHSAGGGVVCVWIGALEFRQMRLGRRSLDKFLFVYVQLIKMGVRSISILDNEGPVFWRK